MSWHPFTLPGASLTRPIAFTFSFSFVTSVQGQAACDCPDDYTGFHCEFPISQLEPSDLDDCSTVCVNNGTCQIGYRKPTADEVIINPDFDPNVLTRFEHCQCPDGFTGVNCELEYTSCGEDAALLCMFGECEEVQIDDSGATDVVCVCQNDEDQSYAGTACAQPATSFCTSSPGVNGRQFCTNNGTCVWIDDG